MLSKRLKSVADFVTKGNIVVDIGTDHGYVPIYLIKENISPFVYASDINEGPLSIAASNISDEDLEDKIELFLSDGFDNFGERYAGTVIISGMGGDLIVDILSRSNLDFEEIVLSPHKRVDKVRKFLADNGYKIVDEKMIEDAGKFYPIIKAKKGNASYTDLELEFGPVLLERHDEVLKKVLDVDYEKFLNIRSNLKDEDKEIEKKIKLLDEGRRTYG